jgi:hypothetical protein
MNQTFETIADCYQSNELLSAYLQYPCQAHDGHRQSQFIIHDGATNSARPSQESVLFHEPQRFITCLGDLELYLSRLPNPAVYEYQRGFNTTCKSIIEVPEMYKNLDKKLQGKKLITTFPHEPINPDIQLIKVQPYYDLLSKESLPKMNVPIPHQVTCSLNFNSKNWQENINVFTSMLQQNGFKLPCVVKLTHGLSGEGTWVLKSQSDIQTAVKQLTNYTNQGLVNKVVAQEYINNITGNYGLQMVIHPNGNYTFMGMIKQEVNGVEFEGGIIDNNASFDPPEPVQDIMKNIALYAANQGYQGWAAIDILFSNEKWYVLDPNFRLSGNAPLALHNNTLADHGLQYSQLTTSLEFPGSIEDVLEKFQNELERRTLIILSAAQKQGSNTVYAIMAGKSMSNVQQLKEKLLKKNVQPIS